MLFLTILIIYRFDSELLSAEGFDRLRDLMNERLDDLQSQRDSAFTESQQVSYSELGYCLYCRVSGTLSSQNRSRSATLN